MYRNKVACSLTALALLVMVLLVVTGHGTRNRFFAPGKETVTVTTSEEAYQVWQQKGVRGRTLVLFDRYPHMRGRFHYQGEPRLDSTNLVEFSVFNNVIRRIYFVVPDSAWNDFLREETTKPIRSLPELGKAVSLYNLNGLPVIATTPSSLPHLAEQVLVYINAGLFNVQQAQDLLARKIIDSDITVVYQGNRQ